jgi:hypothetical protein
MAKQRLLLVLFLATVLTYVGTLFWSIHDYQALVSRQIETRLEQYPPDWVSYMDFLWFAQTRQGTALRQLGFAVGFVWLVGLALFGRYMKTRDLRVLARIIPVLGILWFVGGIMAFFYYEESAIFRIVVPFHDYVNPLMLLGIVFSAWSPVLWAQAKADTHTRRTWAARACLPAV